MEIIFHFWRNDLILTAHNGFKKFTEIWIIYIYHFWKISNKHECNEIQYFQIHGIVLYKYFFFRV